MRKYKDDLQRAHEHAERVKKKYEIKEIYHSNDKKRKPLAFSKVAFIIIFLDCLVIQFFSMFFMWTYPEVSDISALTGIALALIGEVGTVLGYYRKTAVENSEHGIVYETTMNQIKKESDLTECEITNAVG